MTPQQRRFALALRPTAGCPSMRRLDSAAERRTWTAREREHVQACEFCQRCIAYSWDDACPGLDELLSYAEAPASYQDRLAMAFHLEQRNCAPCTRLLSSRAFAQCLAFHRPAPATGDPAPYVSESAGTGGLVPAFGHARLLLHGELPAEAAAGLADAACAQAMTGDRLSMESDLTAQGHIVARVFTKDGTLAGHEVFLALSTADRTLTATMPLVRRGRSLVAETTFALDAVPADYILEGTLLSSVAAPTPEAMEALATACRNQDAGVRLEAALACGAMCAAAATPAALKILAELAEDSDEAVRGAAARALLKALSGTAREADEHAGAAGARTPERPQPIERRGELDAAGPKR